MVSTLHHNFGLSKVDGSRCFAASQAVQKRAAAAVSSLRPHGPHPTCARCEFRGRRAFLRIKGISPEDIEFGDRCADDPSTSPNVTSRSRICSRLDWTG